jgi:thiol-disulfide isomerase/thioredoxin
VLVNVWATWCLPCREELPELLRLRREYASRGLRLILVSGDFPSERSQVERFLEELGIDFATYLKDGSDMEFINTLHASWSGALPATFLFDAGGTLRKFWEGRASYATLERGVVDAINDAPGRGDAKEPS